MLGRILAIVRRDMIYSRRERIIVYILVAPFLVAMILRLVLPVAESAAFRFAVDDSVPEHVVQGLQAYGEVEAYWSRDALRERVGRFDDVPGVFREGDAYVVLVEGNEADYIKQLTGALLDHVVQGREVLDFDYRPSGVEAKGTREFAAAFLAFFCVLIGSITVGFSLVNEREMGTVRALSVSPISTAEFLVGKSLVAVVVGVVLALASTALFLGPANVPYVALLGAVLPLMGLVIVYGFFIGFVASSQLGAISAMKTGNVLLIAIPIIAQFLSGRLKWLVYPFPNYWGFEALRRVFLDTDLSRTAANLLTLVTGLVLIGILVPRVRATYKLG